MLADGDNGSLTVLFGHLVQARKRKYYVPLFRYGRAWCCLVISSDPDRLVRARPDLHPCEVTLESHQHASFLDRTSFAYVTTTNLVYVSDTDVLSAKQVGALSKDARQDLIEAIERCPELKNKTKRLAREALVDPAQA